MSFMAAGFSPRASSYRSLPLSVSHALNSPSPPPATSILPSGDQATYWLPERRPREFLAVSRWRRPIGGWDRSAGAGPGGGNRLAVGRDCHAVDLASDGRYGVQQLARRRVPQPHRPVRAAGGQNLTVRRPEKSLHGLGMSTKHDWRLANGNLHDADRILVAADCSFSPLGDHAVQSAKILRSDSDRSVIPPVDTFQMQTM